MLQSGWKWRARMCATAPSWRLPASSTPIDTVWISSRDLSKLDGGSQLHPCAVLLAQAAGPRLSRRSGKVRGDSVAAGWQRVRHTAACCAGCAAGSRRRRSRRLLASAPAASRSRLRRTGPEMTRLPVSHRPPPSLQARQQPQQWPTSRSRTAAFFPSP